MALNRNLGLPNAFVELWFDIEFHLGRLRREIERLAVKRIEAEATSDPHKSLAARVSQRRERFQTIAAEKFDYCVFR
jgi:hypothetical protein